MLMTQLLWICVFTGIGSQAYVEEFNRANSFYMEGEYRRAADVYERLVVEGVEHPVVFYNLGNAYYKLRQLGYAIANYHRAIYLKPNFTMAKENLTTCITETRQKLALPEPQSWGKVFYFLHSSFSPKTVYYLALTIWLGLWAVLAYHSIRPSRMSIVLALFLAILSITSGISAWQKAHPPRLAVTCEPEVPVRYGPGDAETLRFNLYEGDRAIIEEQKDDWVRVATANGDRGWARRKDFLLVGPPYETRTKQETPHNKEGIDKQ